MKVAVLIAALGTLSAQTPVTMQAYIPFTSGPSMPVTCSPPAFYQVGQTLSFCAATDTWLTVVLSTPGGPGAFTLYDSGGINGVTLQAPIKLTAPYVLALPSSPPLVGYQSPFWQPPVNGVDQSGWNTPPPCPVAQSFSGSSTSYTASCQISTLGTTWFKTLWVPDVTCASGATLQLQGNNTLAALLIVEKAGTPIVPADCPAGVPQTLAYDPVNRVWRIM